MAVVVLRSGSLLHTKSSFGRVVLWFFPSLLYKEGTRYVYTFPEEEFPGQEEEEGT